MTSPPLDRRRFHALLATAGLAAPSLSRALGAQDGELTAADVERAEALTGLAFTPDERELMARGLNELREQYAALRALPLDNAVPPALRFDPVPAGAALDPPRGASAWAPAAAGPRPANAGDLAFAPVAELAALLRERRVTSVELTELSLARLERHDPALACVVTLLREPALEAAARADAELDAGDVRGPLHGVPWGAKDLLAARAARTTWGAKPFEHQHLDVDATAVRRLEEAGAVLVAKLSLGALAWGDVWFGGTTRNPWNVEQGSSGSSAGSAAATAAGLVGFALGSETWGSIVSPCTRCGATGLRPTFGRVSRHGAMALSWSMDKLGPIARTVEDCGLVLGALLGPDGNDPTTVDLPFPWPWRGDVSDLRVGYVPALFEPPAGDEQDGPAARRAAWSAHDRRALDVLRGLGCELVPVAFPDVPVEPLSFVLTAEAAAAFDELSRSGADDQLVRQVEQAWPNVFRQGRTIPAVDYLRANRVRTQLMRAMEETLSGVDLWIHPTFAGANLLRTNLTGHPCVVLPHGFADDGTPTSITFNGKLFREAELLAVAQAWQEATDHHLRRPELPG